MKVTVLQENLLHALVRVGRIVSPRAQLPIMQNVLLSAEEDGLKIVATSLETSEVVRVGAKVAKNGGICVPARLLTEFVTSLPQGNTELTAVEGSLHISCGGFRATIPGVAASEFPPVSDVDRKKATTLEKEAILGALSRVMFSAATDEGRPLLTGIKIVQKDGETTFAATDGYRLSVKNLELATKEPLDFVIPARALGEVVKTGAEEKEAKELSMVVSREGQLVFLLGDTEIHTRVIDGEYPNFTKIIPTTHTTRVLIEREQLARAVKSASVFARDNANIVRFHLEGQTLTVTANTPQVGENKVDLEVKIDGEGGDMAFNSRFLVEFLANYTENELLFEMTGSLNPGVFKPVKDASYLHIIMPVRVASE